MLRMLDRVRSHLGGAPSAAEFLAAPTLGQVVARMSEDRIYRARRPVSWLSTAGDGPPIWFASSAAGPAPTSRPGSTTGSTPVADPGP